MTLKHFEQGIYDEAKFRHTIANALHQEWATAAIEAQTYGTENYITRCILRDGIKEQRRLLGQVRQVLAEHMYEQQTGISDPARAEFVAKQIASLNSANERMTVAIMHAMERGLPTQPADAQQSIAVTAEVPEIKISLPDRRVDTIFSRNANGVIVSAQQLERDIQPA